jgi:hypothetical protein
MVGYMSGGPLLKNVPFESNEKKIDGEQIVGDISGLGW